MSRPKDQYVIELSSTVVRMFKNGITDPSAHEIAEVHFPKKALGGEIIEGIRKRLIKIRDMIIHDYSMPVYLLNGRYYRRFRTKSPKTVAEGRRCIPLGHGVKAEGVRLNTKGDEDFVWQAMIDQGLVSGAGKVKAGLDRTLGAVDDGRLDDERAAAIMKSAANRAEPDNRQLAAKIRALIEEVSDEN